MIILCTESSHARGMGHLYRMLVYSDYLKSQAIDYLFLINDDEAALKVLLEHDEKYRIVDYEDDKSSWVKELAATYSPKAWINDKYETSESLGAAIKAAGVRFAMIDDRGEGAKYCDIHFVGMMFDVADSDIRGNSIYRGLEYNILNPEIVQFRGLHRHAGKVLVTLGGSDTYGATVKAVKVLKDKGISADIITGASFRHNRELEAVVAGDANYRLLGRVPSLIQTMSEYDVAVTGGGVTALEACGLGVPTIIIANEIHEIDTGRYFEKMGAAHFAGYHEEIDTNAFDIDDREVERLSKKALELIPAGACERITDYVFNGQIKGR